MDAFQALPIVERDAFRYVGGHFAYGFQRAFDRPCRYVTMLRDPVDAMVSMYHYVRRCEGHPSHVWLPEGTDGSGDFLAWRKSDRYGHLDNYQLRAIVGHTAAEKLGPVHLELAKVLLRKEFAAFGMVERFNESLLFIQDAFGWGPPCYTPVNVYAQPGDRSVLTPEAMDFLREHHALSFELVAFARELFDERVHAAGRQFVDRLGRFREASAEWQRQRQSTEER